MVYPAGGGLVWDQMMGVLPEVRDGSSGRHPLGGLCIILGLSLNK